MSRFNLHHLTLILLVTVSLLTLTQVIPAKLGTRCPLGLSGDRCNQCAIGYSNSNSTSNGTGHLDSCIKCDACFDQWHLSIENLGELSINLIGKSSELSLALMSNLLPDQSNAKLTSAKNKDDFGRLNELLTNISDKIFEFKRDADLLNLLGNELRSTINDLDSATNSLNNLKSILSFSTSIRSLSVNIREMYDKLYTIMRIKSEAIMIYELTRTINKDNRAVMKQLLLELGD